MDFVTGGTGLVGSHLLVDLLQGGKAVRALKRSTSRVDHVQRLCEHYAPGKGLFEQIEWVDGDLLDVPVLADHLDGITDVYHCAAMVSFSPNDRDELFRINIEGTANLVNLSLQANVRKFCFVSSTAAIGGKADGRLIHEKTAWESDFAQSPYALSKHYGEREVWRGIEEGLSAVIVNPCVVIGPGEWGKSSTGLIDRVWRGLKFYTGGGNAFVDARDVSLVMRRLMESDIVAQRYLVIGENLPYEDVFKLIANGLGKNPPKLKLRPWVTETVWRLERVLQLVIRRSPIMTRATAASSQSVKRFANDKIREALGLEFTPVAQSIAETCAIFKQEVEAGLIKH